MRARHFDKDKMRRQIKSSQVQKELAVLKKSLDFRKGEKQIIV